jgi:hypothetical protein
MVMAMALEELGAAVQARGLGVSDPSPGAPVWGPLHWLGGGLGAYLWQVGWAAGTRPANSPLTSHRALSLIVWLAAAGSWIWFLFPPSNPAPASAASIARVTLAAALGILLPLLERFSFRSTGRRSPGAVLRFAWWGCFLS